MQPELGPRLVKIGMDLEESHGIMQVIPSLLSTSIHHYDYYDYYQPLTTIVLVLNMIDLMGGFQSLIVFSHV